MGSLRQQEYGLDIDKGDFRTKFDIKINTPKSCVWVGYFKRCSKELAAALVDREEEDLCAC